jgi:membrane protein involved in colicin uptake
MLLGRLYDGICMQENLCVAYQPGPDGQLLDINGRWRSGFCQAALTAAKREIPKPPSQAVYEKIKMPHWTLNCSIFPVQAGKTTMVVTGFW